MEWLQRLLDGESGMAVQLVVITLGLVILLILLFWIFRKITGAAAPKSARNRVPRLSVTDSARVDENRYLVLVRRDNVEHLIMIGGPGDLVVETNIVRIAAESSNKSMRTKANLASVERDIEPSPTVEPVEDQTSTPKPDTSPVVPIAAAAVAANLNQSSAGSGNQASSIGTEEESSDHSLPDVSDLSKQASVEKALEIAEPAAAAMPSIEEVEPEEVSKPTEIEIPVDASVDAEQDLEAELKAQMEEEMSTIAEIANNPVQDVAPEVPLESDKVDPDFSEPGTDIETSDLESAISERLEDMLGSETLQAPQVEPEIDTVGAEASSTPQSEHKVEPELSEKPPHNKEKDDMQRLLDELAGVKESAE